MPFCVGGSCSATACGPGKSDCNANMGDGCECNTPACCGSGCQTTHADGFGQSFYDCVALGTHSAAQATEAADVWNINGDIAMLQCTDVVAGKTYHENVICDQTATQCACWAYQDTPTGGPYTGSGYALVTNMPGTIGNFDNCFCPVDTAPPNVPWN